MPIKVFHHAELESTQDEAKRLIEKNDVESSFAVVADIQTKGYGTHGRIWQTCAGNLLFTVCFKVDASQQLAYHLLSPLVSCVVIDVIKDQFGFDQLRLKWPNDGVVKDQKMFGVLIEVIGSYVLMGVGFNTNNYPELSERLTTSLKKELNFSSDIDNSLVLKNILERLELSLKQWEEGRVIDFITSWNQHSCQINQPFRYILGARTFSGTFLGLNPEGFPHLKDDEGSIIFIR